MPSTGSNTSDELWYLTVRERIRDLVASYTHAGDSGRVRELAELFNDDAVLNIHEVGSATSPDGIFGLLTQLAAAGRPPGNSQRFYIRHSITNLNISEVQSSAALAASYFSVITPDGLDHWGRYRDSFAPDPDGVWKFSSRFIRVDGWRPGGWYERLSARSV